MKFIQCVHAEKKPKQIQGCELVKNGKESERRLYTVTDPRIFKVIESQ